ncbi:riboflavin synthase subunit alpha [Anoxybacter fermentans]|uniref:Riboflavin synthase n=1 Tax=Anoxybacter fermentans TaxID=1323375 RepID=A0A3Q9HPT0_9FIRM|nr:riboflavin synthase [Anoxybacter fermentans]AZR72954.1 riboflavin synthase subunit alpha [Anoxybacter fermentans]
MFTGIIEEVGIILNITRGTNSGSLTIAAKKVLEDVEIGDSIAVNGVCLTVTSFTKGQFTADVMPVTLDKTNLGELSPGKKVNLERALQLKSRLGGHLVSGHVDGVGTILSINQDDNAILIEIEAPEKLKPFVIREGSIAVDGISLTVAELTPKGFCVSIIPHTAKKTTLANRKVGDRVNLEGDIIGKYLYHFWQQLNNDEKALEKSSRITKEFLAANGFF